MNFWHIFMQSCSKTGKTRDAFESFSNSAKLELLMILKNGAHMCESNKKMMKASRKNEESTQLQKSAEPKTARGWGRERGGELSRPISIRFAKISSTCE